MKVLIIDDDAGIRQTLGIALEEAGHLVATANGTVAARKRLQDESFEVAFLDVRLGLDNGIELIPELLKLAPRLVIIVMTAYSSIESAVQAMQSGAADYLTKPFKPAQISQLLERVKKTQKLERRVQELEQRVDDSEIDLTSAEPAMKRVLELAEKAAASHASILLLGETGTGKSVLARRLHQKSPRSGEPFVTVNCPSLSRELFESELFGHVKGAFTGAVADTWGKVAAADKGTLFLDEIGELPLEIQPKLLRLLQEKQFERVGEAKVRHSDVRIIAATHRDLKAAVRAGAFREDLLYRIEVMSLTLPPLRDRPGDLLGLAERHLKKFARQDGKTIGGLSPEARTALESYAWPGNLRELRNIIERAVILCGEGLIGLDDLPETLLSTVRPGPALGAACSLEEIEKEHIRRVLARAKSVQQAASIQRIDPTTLLRKRKELD